MMELVQALEAPPPVKNKINIEIAHGPRTSGLYYKTFRIVIYDRKLRSSLEHKLQSYDRNPSYG